ncbi:hypothetical protein ACQ4PT_061992 [Festuca glaucescens]
MAGRWLEHLIVLCRAGGLAVAAAALSVLAVANENKSQVRWLCLGGEQPGNAHLLVLIAGEWMVACFTVGTACAAITANLFALQNHYCAAGVACVLYLVAAAMAWAAGALAAVSALGMAWIHGSRFRPAQAP